MTLADAPSPSPVTPTIERVHGELRTRLGYPDNAETLGLAQSIAATPDRWRGSLLFEVLFSSVGSEIYKAWADLADEGADDD